VRPAIGAVGALVGVLLVICSLVTFFGHRNEPLSLGSIPQGPTKVATHPSPRALKSGPVVSPTSVYPIRVLVPRLGVDAAVIPVAVTGSGSLGVPSDPRTVGWWAGGALPGASSGSAVLVGHVDSATAGEGALFQLRRLVPGDVVVVDGGGGSVDYKITGLREYHKATLPAAQIFVRNGVARLVMITCGGSFNTQTHHYQDNVIAYGTRVDSSTSGTSRLIPNPS
jgi:hypothetical protein